LNRDLSTNFDIIGSVDDYLWSVLVLNWNIGALKVENINSINQTNCFAVLVKALSVQMGF
jgi:hypothetical protein